MTTYFAGGGFDCWIPAPSGVSDNTNSISVGYNYCRANIVDATGTPISVTSLWFHSTITANNYDPGNGNVPFEFRDSANSARARFRFENDGSGYGYVFEYYDGSTWHGTAPVDVGRAFGGTIDAQIVIDPVVGKIAWYNNGILAAQLTNINTSGMGSINYFIAFRVEGYIGSGTYTDTIIASYNTIGHTIRRRAITGNGPEQAWTGDYTDVNENQTNDSNALTTSSTGAVSTFTGTALSPTAAGAVIKSVVIGTRVRASGDTPSHVQAVVNVGGTDYEGPSIGGNGGFQGFTTAFDNDPSTSAPWASITPVNGALGVKAVA